MPLPARAKTSHGRFMRNTSRQRSDFARPKPKVDSDASVMKKPIWNTDRLPPSAFTQASAQENRP